MCKNCVNLSKWQEVIANLLIYLHDQGTTGANADRNIHTYWQFTVSNSPRCLCLGCRRKSENLGETLQTHRERTNSLCCMSTACLILGLTTCFGLRFVVKTQNQMVKLNTGHNPQTQSICSFLIPKQLNAVKRSQVCEWNAERFSSAFASLHRVSCTLGWECCPRYLSTQED